jgi:hypothetical protein
LWILWNSDRTFPITQDGVCFCTHTFAIIWNNSAHDFQYGLCIC